MLDYEKEVEDVAPVTPPITKSQTTKRQVVSAKAGKPQSVKYKPTTKAIDQERSINTRAFVVHGIPCQRPMADTIQDVRKTGIRGIVGARWLLGGQRRAGKTTSSIVIFLSIPISFQVQEGQAGMKVRGHWPPINAYDFDRGRKRLELRSDW